MIMMMMMMLVMMQRLQEESVRGTGSSDERHVASASTSFAGNECIMETVYVPVVVKLCHICSSLGSPTLVQTALSFLLYFYLLSFFFCRAEYAHQMYTRGSD